MASSIAKQLTPRCGIPTLEDVRTHLKFCFKGADEYAEPFYRAMEKQHWLDRNRKPITDWKALAKAYASKAHMKRLKEP